MDLRQIIQMLMEQMNPMSDEERMKRAQLLNSRAPRGPDGNIKQQGDWGIYSDSLPYTLEDHFRNNKPGFWNQLQKPQPTMTPRMFEDLMKKPPPYSGMI